ncbi:DUF6338 family protein [Paracidovorax valerianellae]|uniref:Uncharacterized protein n=1 Tax=Paracidovorax valerianellae TaxID=187868 RepID=A0A1G6PR29_9BURK|nr:DUF6338 family protein [Paracidovorax valerianellae]MDA8444953.1 DUF6338 family protein [Paracidovorax valerianellae]SDC82431.1 hypothetical protein SAMN05192589_103313 [Paracidovorax valerianellae]
MPELSKDVVALLQYLAPGFLVAWVYFGLTSHIKPSQFERVVQALVFTVAVQAIVAMEKWGAERIGSRWFSLGEWTSESTLMASMATAILLGVGVSTLTNTDGIHALARKLGLSKRSGHPGEWFGAFCDCPRYVVLQLKDGSRIYGWPSRWPSESSNGHFFITDVTRQANGETQVLVQLEGILIDAKDVASVEFVKEPETNDGQAPSTCDPTAA